MDFTKHNKSQFKKIEWSRKTEGFSFKKINDFYEEGITEVQVFGFFFTKSPQYGLQPNAILADCLLNLPSYLKETIEDMLSDEEAVRAIDNGECTLGFRPYQSLYGKKTCYGVTFKNTTTTGRQTEAQAPIF